MKLHRSLLEQFVDLPTTDNKELRHVFDDLGLEVENIEEKGSDAIFNLEILANRGDHLSALGCAREFAARYEKEIKQIELVDSLSLIHI